MDVRFGSRDLERQCTDAKHMQKKFGVQMAKTLKLRLNELHMAKEMADLLSMPGRWEELRGDRNGQWSARLTKNWRLIVEPGDDSIVVWIVDITDYH